MSENLNYFKGKVCTIICRSMNRNFQEEGPKTYPTQVYDYFVGIVESIDQNGILLKKINNNLKSYFYHSSIICISEEEVIDDTHPMKEKILKEFEESKKIERDIKSSVAKNTTDDKYIDISELEILSNKFKNKS